MKSKNALYRYILSSISLSILQIIFDILNSCALLVIRVGGFIGALFLLSGWLQYRRTMEVGRNSAVGIAIIIVICLIKPLLLLLRYILAKLMKAQAQAKYDYTGVVPEGWSVESNYDSEQSYQKENSGEDQYQRDATNGWEQSFEYNEQVYRQEMERLAEERERLLRDKNRLEREMEQQRRQTRNQGGGGNDLFAGCTDEVSVKKRYRELLKIYHPDNQNGDTSMVEEVNRQYERRRR